jgi:ligand-binding sensor domain-containing protein/signal transduction histidine kinase
MRMLLAWAGLAVLFADDSWAIDPNRAMSQYVRDHWGTEQGFPRGSVYAIAQTADGYLWIGSEVGLIRFDGTNFRVMRDPSGSVIFTIVLGLVADKDGSLWVRLRDMTLIRYRDGRFENPFGGVEPPLNTSAMALANNGELMVIQTRAVNRLLAGVRILAADPEMPRSPIISVAQTGDGKVWMGTRGAGLFRTDSGKASAIIEGLPDPKINCLLPDGARELWVGTDKGVAHWNGTAFVEAGIPQVNKTFQALSIVKDRDANIWIGTARRGVLRLNARGMSSFAETDRQPPPAVTALFEDREGSLWVGSSDGIERIRDSTFVTYSAPEGLPTDGSNPVFVDADNRMWFRPVSGGLWWMKDGQHGRVSAAGLDDDVVYSIAGEKNELWLARQRGGLTRLSEENGAWHATSYNASDGLAQNSVYSVYCARDGSIWAGTLSGGVSKLDHGKFTTYTTADGLASNTVASILEGSDGAMWFATPTGLSSHSKGHWRTFKSADGLPSENVNCLLEDRAGLLWAGTTAGLSVLSSGHFAALVNPPAALREQILGLAEDQYDSLWISTSNHVLRVKREALLHSGASYDEVRDYGLADGLRGVEGVKRHRSVVRDSLGRIWFSLNRGISVVDPGRLRSSSAPAIAQIETLSADGAELETRGSVRIPAARQRIVFSYAGLILSNPERVRFRYRLDDFDKGWSAPVADREAVYPNLSPGSYRFRVVASNPDGVWSGREAVLAFGVDPAYWQTWWFRAGLVLSCVLAAMAIYRLRLHQLTARLNVRFEERLAERTRIAQELHDTLLQGFLSACMHVDVAVSRLPGDSPLKPSLTAALDLMRQVTDEGRRTVNGLRSSEGASLDLEVAFLQIQDELLPKGRTGVPVNYRVLVEGKRRPLHSALRDEVYRIGREALINAFRHARAKSIEVELNYSSAAFRMVVRDDGCGIDPQTLETGRDGHWGLSGMRERANRIGARLRLFSSVDGGTEVELSLPGHLAFHDPKQRFWGERSKVAEEQK